MFPINKTVIDPGLIQIPASFSSRGTGAGMDPFTIMSLAGLIGQGLGAFGAARNANEDRELSGRQFDRNMTEQQRQFNLQFGQGQAQTGLMATQMDPFAQQRSRQRQALLGSIMANYQPATLEGNRYTGGLRLPPEVFQNLARFSSPGAMAANEMAFHNTAQAAAPTYNIPNYYQTGYPQGVGGLGPNTPIGSAGRPTPFALPQQGMTQPTLGNPNPPPLPPRNTIPRTNSRRDLANSLIRG